MGTYLTALVTGPLVDLEKVKLKKLPTWELDDVIGWDLDEIRGPGNLMTGEWRLFLEGNSKWANEDSYGWAERFTTKRPTLQVSIREEWDNRDADEAGIEERVYRQGVLCLGDSRQNGEVAMNLSELIEQGRQAIVFYEAGASYGPSTMAAALRALIDGLV
jgi:hypothetical protein